jgi:photosystem II stability/assembly factor-like uncharacterized protein
LSRFPCPFPNASAVGVYRSFDDPISMRHTFLLSALLLSFGTHAQWELVTPIKTRSEFTALHMVSDAVGFAVDNPMGAILRTSDGGHHWERMVNGLTNNPIGMHVWDDQRAIVVGENGSVYRTTNAFTTITGSSDVLFGHFNCVFFVNDTLGWAGTGAGRVYRSTDAGVNWTLMNSGLGSSNDIHAIQFLDTQTGYLVCAGGGTVRKSTDGGLTWQESWGGANTTFLDLHFFDDLTGVCVGLAGIVVRTTDGGSTWDSIPSNSNYIMNSLDAQGDVLVACGWWGRTIRSTDAGLSWTELQVGNSEHRSISLLPSGQAVMGTDGRIHGSSDLGLTWSIRHLGTFHTRLNKVSFMNADTGVAVGWQTTGGLESGLLRTIDGGRSWTNAGTGGLGVHVNPAGQGCLGGGSGAFARTANGFDTRTPGSGPNVAIRCTWTIDANTHFVAGGAVFGGIYRTTNAGASWTQVLNVGNITISDLWFTSAQNGYAVGEYGDNYRTTDGGATWVPMTGTPGGHTVFFLDEDHGWMKYRRTVDGGATWTDINGAQTTMSMFFTSVDTGYTVMSSGQTLKTVDGGLTWVTILPEILNTTVGDATYVDGAIVIVCNNGDIFRAQIGCPAIAAVPVITENGNTLCTTTSGTAQWFRNGEPLAGDGSNCIEAMETGAYTVVVTDALGCVSAPSSPVQVIQTLTAEQVALTGLLVFPNPATQLVRIAHPGYTGASQVMIMDAHGRMVWSGRMVGAGFSVDVSNWSPGLYLVRLITPSGTEVVRFVKE